MAPLLNKKYFYWKVYHTTKLQNYCQSDIKNRILFLWQQNCHVHWYVCVCQQSAYHNSSWFIIFWIIL